MNSCFYSLLIDDNSSMLSSNNHPCNLSLSCKTRKNNSYEDNSLYTENFADELEYVTITYDVN